MKRQITISDEAKAALVRLKAEAMQITGKAPSYSKLILMLCEEHKER